MRRRRASSWGGRGIPRGRKRKTKKFLQYYGTDFVEKSEKEKRRLEKEGKRCAEKKEGQG